MADNLKDFDSGVSIVSVVTGSGAYNADGSINLSVVFAHVTGVLPFTASPDDKTDYGVWLFERAKAGDFGAIAALPALPLAQQRQEALAKLNTEFTAAMASLQAGWPDYEVKTWDIQSEEAKQWTAASVDDKPMTPFLTQLFNQRAALGWTEPFADLVARIITNTQNYTLATANYIAVRHVAERDINAASDPSKVKWSF